jgi:hypothetical protein
LIAWSLALAVSVTDVNSNAERSMENGLNELLDGFNETERQRRRALKLAIVGLAVSVMCSFSPFCALNTFNPLAQVPSIVLLTYAFMCEFSADSDSLSIFHDAALLTLKEGSVTVKALDSFSASLVSSMHSSSKKVFSSYTIVFIGFLNVLFNLLTNRASGLSIQLQPHLSTFSMIVPISASILLGLSQWSERIAVRGSLESSCTSVWLKMPKEVRPFLFEIFMDILFLYVLSLYVTPMLLTSTTGANYILTAGVILISSFYFGLGLGLLALLAFLVMLLTFFRDFIYLACSAVANTGK